MVQIMQRIEVEKNNMHINYNKTDYMILGITNKQNVFQEFDIRIDDKHIKKTQSHKLYGIHIDDKQLTFKKGFY